MLASYDTIVVGGGLVGSAVGCGLVRRGQRLLVLDEGDVAFRASRGNFGLVWVQGRALACRPTPAGPDARAISGRSWRRSFAR